MSNSNRAFQGYRWCCFQLYNSSIGQVCDELEHFVVPCDSNPQLYGSRGNSFYNVRFSCLSQPKRCPTPVLGDALLHSPVGMTIVFELPWLSHSLCDCCCCICVLLFFMFEGMIVRYCYGIWCFSLRHFNP